MVVYDKFFGSEWYKWSFPVLHDDERGWDKTANSSYDLTPSVSRGLYKVPNPALSQSTATPRPSSQQNRSRSPAPPPTASLMDEFLPWYQRETRSAMQCSSRFESIPGSRQMTLAPHLGRHQTPSSKLLTSPPRRKGNIQEPRRCLPQRRQSRHFVHRQSLMPPGYTDRGHKQVANPWVHVSSYHHPGSGFNVYPQGSSPNVNAQGSTFNVYSSAVSIRQLHHDIGFNTPLMSSNTPHRALNYHSYARGIPSNTLQTGLNCVRNTVDTTHNLQPFNYIKYPSENIVSNHHARWNYNYSPKIKEISPETNAYKLPKNINAVSESTSLEPYDYPIGDQVSKTGKRIFPIPLDGLQEENYFETTYPLSAVSENMIQGVKSLIQVIPLVYRKVVDFFTKKEDIQVKLWSTMKPSNQEQPINQNQMQLHGQLSFLNQPYASSDYDSYGTNDTTTTCALCAARLKNTGTASTQTEPLSTRKSATCLQLHIPKYNKIGVGNEGLIPITKRECIKNVNGTENVGIDSLGNSSESSSSTHLVKTDVSKQSNKTLMAKNSLLPERNKKRVIPQQGSKPCTPIESQTNRETLQQAQSRSPSRSPGTRSADTSVMVSDLEISPSAGLHEISPGSSEYTTPMGSPLRRQKSPKFPFNLILRGSPGKWGVVEGLNRVSSFVDVKSNDKGQSPKRSRSAAGLAKRKASFKMTFALRSKKKMKDVPRKLQKRTGPLKKVPTFVRSVKEETSTALVVPQGTPSKTRSNQSCTSNVSLRLPPVRLQNPGVKKLKGPQFNVLNQLKQETSTSSVKSPAIPSQVPSNCSCISSISVKSKSIWANPIKKPLPHQIPGKTNSIFGTVHKKDLGPNAVMKSNLITGQIKPQDFLLTKTNIQKVKRTSTTLLKPAENGLNKRGDVEMPGNAKTITKTSMNKGSVEPLTNNNKYRAPRLTARSLSLLGTKQSNKKGFGQEVKKEVSPSSANKDSSGDPAGRDAIYQEVSSTSQKSHHGENKESQNLKFEEKKLGKSLNPLLTNKEERTQELKGKQDKRVLQNDSSGSSMDLQNDIALNSNKKNMSCSSEDSLSNASSEQLQTHSPNVKIECDQNETTQDDDSQVHSSILQSPFASTNKDVFKTMRPLPSFSTNKTLTHASPKTNNDIEEIKIETNLSPNQEEELNEIKETNEQPPISLDQQITEQVFDRCVSLMAENLENATNLNNTEQNMVECSEEIIKPEPEIMDSLETQQSSIIGDSRALINTNFVTNLTTVQTQLVTETQQSSMLEDSRNIINTSFVTNLTQVKTPLVTENKPRPLIAPAKFIFQSKISDELYRPAALSESNSTTEWSNSTSKQTDTASSSDEHIDKNLLTRLGKQIGQLSAEAKMEGASDSQSNASNTSKTSINTSIRNLAKTSARTKKARTATRKEDLPPSGKKLSSSSRPNSESERSAYTGQSPPEAQALNAVMSSSELRGKSPAFNTEKLKKLEMTKYVGIVQDSDGNSSKENSENRTSPRTKKRKDTMPNSEEVCKQRKRSFIKKPISVPVFKQNLPSPHRNGSKKACSFPLTDRSSIFLPIDTPKNSKYLDILPNGKKLKYRTTKLCKRSSNKERPMSERIGWKKTRNELSENETTVKSVSTLRGMFESSGLKPPLKRSPEKNTRGKKVPAKSTSKDSMSRYRISTKQTLSDSNVSSNSIHDLDRQCKPHGPGRTTPEDSKSIFPKPRRLPKKAMRPKDPDSSNVSASSTASKKQELEGKQKRSSSATKSQVQPKKTVNLTRSLSNNHVQNLAPVSLSARRFVAVKDKPSDPPLAETLFQADPVLNPSPTSTRWQYAYFSDKSTPPPPRP